MAGLHEEGILDPSCRMLDPAHPLGSLDPGLGLQDCGKFSIGGPGSAETIAPVKKR